MATRKTVAVAALALAGGAASFSPSPIAGSVTSLSRRLASAAASSTVCAQFLRCGPDPRRIMCMPAPLTRGRVLCRALCVRWRPSVVYHRLLRSLGSAARRGRRAMESSP